MARERSESQVEWSRRLARWKRSRLTVQEFAQQEGVSPGQLAWWQGRLQTLRNDVRAPPQALAFVGLVGAPAAVGVEVVLRGGGLVRVPVGFDEGTVARLVRILEGEAR